MSCPYCSYCLPNHLRFHKSYWYCQQCQMEIDQVAIAMQQNLANNLEKKKIVLV